MRHQMLVLTLVVIASLGGCVSVRTSSSDLQALTLCNAGVSSETSAKLTAKVEEKIRDGVEFDAAFKDELKGTFLNGANVSEENAVQLYDRYLKCIEDVRVRYQASSS